MAKDEITQDDVKEYVKCGGEYCPFCRSPEVITDGVMIHCEESAKVYRPMSCTTCDRDWTDVFDLQSIVPVMPVVH